MEAKDVANNKNNAGGTAAIAANDKISLHQAVAKAMLLLISIFNLKQEEIAKKCSVTQGHLSQVINGKKIPSLKLCERIAEALGVTHTELMAIAYKEFYKQDRDVQSVERGLREWHYRRYIAKIMDDIKGSKSSSSGQRKDPQEA